MLMQPNIHLHVNDHKTFVKLKILSFNNLACLYKKKRKLSIALRAVSFALELSEYLLKSQTCDEKYDIISTYLNKAAIYS
jgi:hypothetical protein